MEAQGSVSRWSIQGMCVVPWSRHDWAGNSSKTRLSFVNLNPKHFPRLQVHGAVVIFDMDGLSLSQTWQFTPPFAKRIVDWLQDSVPLRIKGIHIVNQPKIFNIVFALFKPFLREKLRKRIIFHGSDRDSLHVHISPKCLPLAYGGTIETPRITGEQWHQLLVKCDPEFKQINSYGYQKF